MWAKIKNKGKSNAFMLDKYVLKVSKFRKQIMVQKLLPKPNQADYPGRLLLQG